MQDEKKIQSTTFQYLDKALNLLPNNDLTAGIRSHMYNTARQIRVYNKVEILDNKNEVCFTCGYGKKGTPLTLRSKKMPRIVRRLQKTRVADLNTFYQIISKKKYMNQGICNQIMTTKCAMCKNILAGVVKKCFNVITFRKNIKKISEIDLMGLIAKDELSKLTKKQLNVAWRIGLEKTKGRDLKKLIGQNFTNPKQNIICAPGTPELIKSNSLEAPDVLTNLKFT